MNRRTFLGTLAGGLLAVPLAATAQQVGKLYRLGVLITGRPQASVRLLPNALRELGYIEGQNLTIEWRFAEGDVARLPELAADLVRLKVDVILAGFTLEILAAKQATTAIPIVMVGGVDPVGNGIVASLPRPGGNITGMTIQPPEFGGKLVELLKQAVPTLSRLAVVWEPRFPGFLAYYQHSQTAATTLGLKLMSVELQQTSDIDTVLVEIKKEHPDGLTAWPSPAVAAHMPRLLRFAVENRLPAIYPTSTYMHIGGLMSYGVNFEEVYRRIAVYVDKILKGAKPADLPIEQPTTFELLVNLREAKALGLTIPQSFLLRADRVIE